MTAARAPGELQGLHTDQAPPLAIPASFFLLAPLAMIASGALLFLSGSAVFATRWSPSAMAATHLGTLGFLGAVMLGALYQMLPVVAGSPVPRARLAHVVHALLVAGVVTLTAAFVTGELALFAAAPIVLAAAFVLFLVPVAVALARAPTRGPTVWGMRLAVTGLGVLVVFGSVMALARAGLVDIGGDWIGWVSAHAALGGVVWIGGLFTAVSWQVVPMFYLTPPIPRWSQWATLAALALALVAVPGVVALGADRSAWPSARRRRSSWCSGCTRSSRSARSIGAVDGAWMAACAFGGPVSERHRSCPCSRRGPSSGAMRVGRRRLGGGSSGRGRGWSRTGCSRASCRSWSGFIATRGTSA